MADADDADRSGQPAHRLPRARSRRRSPTERTSLESALIPVTAYIVVACAESFLRYPEMMRTIDAAMPAEEIGRRARRPGCQVDPCYLWSIANFFLLGRKIMGDGRSAPATTRSAPPRSSTSGSGPRSAYRGDGTRQAWDTGASRIYDDATVAALLDGARPHRRRRAPGADQAVQRHARQPPVPPLLRHARRLRRHRARTRCRRTRSRRCSCATSTGSAQATSRGRRSPRTCRTTTSPPRSCSTTCESTFTDFGTSNHTPEDYLDRLVGFGLYTTDGCRPASSGRCRSTSTTTIVAAVRNGAGAALPQHRGHGPGREDPLRRLRVLHASSGPSPRIAGVGGRARLDRAPRPARAALPAPLGDARATTPACPRTRPYYEPYPEASP